MPLPPELTRVPISSLDVLRYMGKNSIQSGDSESLATGTGMSSRGMGKAIRGLVTKGYLIMDDAYIYHLTDKGTQAIGDIDAFDAEGGDPEQVENLVEQSLVAVAPSSLGTQAAAIAKLGLDGAAPLAAQLFVRLSALGGDVSPAQVEINLEAGQATPPVDVRITPTGEYTGVRVRAEVLQMITDTDFHEAGGMFFDMPIGQASQQYQAWYGVLNLRA